MPLITTATCPQTQDEKQPSAPADATGCQTASAPKQPAEGTKKVSLSSESSSPSPSPARRPSRSSAKSPAAADKDSPRPSSSSSSRRPSPSPKKRRHAREPSRVRVRRTPPARGRSRTAARGEWLRGRDGRSRTPVYKLCHFGRQCCRAWCAFLHPDGREVDEPSPRPERRQRRRRSSRSGAKRARRHSPPFRSPSRARPRAPSSSSSAARTPRKRRGEAGEEAATEPSPGAQAKLPKPSFRKFVLGMLSKDVKPEEAVAAYEKHCRKLAEKSIAPLRGTGLFFDVYHPISLLRRFDLRARFAQRSAEAFAQDLCLGRYAGLHLRAPPASGGDGRRKGASCGLEGHLLPPHFAFDPDVDALVVTGIQHTTSIWDLYDALAQCRGLAAVSWPRPAAGEASRELRARFSTGGLARGALAALKDFEAAKTAAASPSLELSALVAPPEMSDPERLRKDEALAARAVKLLDGLVGVKPEIAEQLLAQDGATEEKLDLLVLYLRRVHHFCFYAAAWCEDEWDLRARCGTAVLRDPTDTVPEGDWAGAHERRLESFLANPGGARPTVPTRDEQPIAERVAKLMTEQTQQVAEAKFRCMQCNRCFKAPHYAHRHMQKVHTDVLEAVRQKVLEEAAVDRCLEDPRRPSVPAVAS